MEQNENIRNIAIIAHVDHGKTTLVDHMLRQSGMFKQRQKVVERIMDNMDLERERGITITAKNCSIWWKDVKINIIDTPGHADFGGEVERGLIMADGVVLLVDAAEGPLAQTRYVLKKALEADKKIIVVINKIDRKDARPREVQDEIYQLFIDLDAADSQIEFPVLYSIGREGIAQETIDERGEDLQVLFDTILEYIPAPSYDPDEPFQMQVCDLGYSDYLGRLAIGKICNGTAKISDELVCLKKDEKIEPLQVMKFQTYEGVEFEEAASVKRGDIVTLAGIEDVQIGDTICTKRNPKALERIMVDEPTLSMLFSVNTSPFSGGEGKHVQSRKIYERLMKETLLNVGIQLETTGNSNEFIVKGRGEFQMEILIETMAREGFELSIGAPQIIFKQMNGKYFEPMESLFIDCEESCIGIVTQKLSKRKGKMEKLINGSTGRVHIEFTIPSRSLIGYRSEFIVDTAGTGVITSYMKGYEEYRGYFSKRMSGSLVSDRQGKAVAYALDNLSPRGTMFIAPGDPVYEGMIVGEHNKDNDLPINPCKEKQLTNMRSASSDLMRVLTPPRILTLGQAIGFIKEDEMVEVTPQSIRMRKTILPGSARSKFRGEHSRAS